MGVGRFFELIVAAGFNFWGKPDSVAAVSGFIVSANGMIDAE
jgi:hypothetical protein